jgi:hypothetical protein
MGIPVFEAMRTRTKRPGCESRELPHPDPLSKERGKQTAAAEEHWGRNTRVADEADSLSPRERAGVRGNGVFIKSEARDDPGRPLKM